MIDDWACGLWDNWAQLMVTCCLLGKTWIDISTGVGITLTFNGTIILSGNYALEGGLEIDYVSHE
jgi:hypothetical protein